MTLFCSRHDALCASRLPVAKVRSRLKPLFKAIHKAIVTAKMRRLRSELTFSGAHENWSLRMDADAAKFPQRPLILGDKWDF
jgi:hypothetical protein